MTYVRMSWNPYVYVAFILLLPLELNFMLHLDSDCDTVMLDVHLLWLRVILSVASVVSYGICTLWSQRFHGNTTAHMEFISSFVRVQSILRVVTIVIVKWFKMAPFGTVKAGAVLRRYFLNVSKRVIPFHNFPKDKHRFMILNDPTSFLFFLSSPRTFIYVWKCCTA